MEKEINLALLLIAIFVAVLLYLMNDNGPTGSGGTGDSWNLDTTAIISGSMD